MRTRFAFLVLMSLAVSLSTQGCACIRNVVNADASLRWTLFSSFGADRVCPEMLKVGAPLKLDIFGPDSVGRFFPLQCAAHVDNATRTMRLDLTGVGYVSLPVTRRVGFYAAVAFEITPDFRLEEDSTYVWGKFSRLVQPVDLRLLGVENPFVQLATQTPLGSLGTAIGKTVVESQIARGFTVVRRSDGDDFSLGILTPPTKPKRYFTSSTDRVTLGTDVVDIRASSREYLGPFTVEQKNAALYLRAHVTDAPVDYFVVTKVVGDTWREAYLAGKPLGPSPSAPIAFGQALGDHTRNIPLDPGAYYVVVENRAAVPMGPLGPMPFEPVSKFTYAVESGER